MTARVRIDVTAANDHRDTWRLPAHHVQDLRDVAKGVEETNIGVCTRYLLDELERKGPPGEDEVAMYEAERFCDRYDASEVDKLMGETVGPWLRRIQRTRRALALISEGGDHTTIGVLHVAYGYPDPLTRHFSRTTTDFLGPDLVSLVRYTDATEVIRRELVRAGTDQQVALSGSGMTAYALRDCKTFEAPIQGDVVDLTRWRAANRYLDKVITSADALQSVFDTYPEPQPKKVPGEEPELHERRRVAWEARRDTHSARRTTFLVEVRVEADRMLTKASRVYWEAWRSLRTS
jgi:hypothetical protein